MQARSKPAPDPFIHMTTKRIDLSQVVLQQNDTNIYHIVVNDHEQV